jgi:hypothetical protein
MGHGERMGRLRHAAALRHREKDVEIAQLDPPSDPVVPAHGHRPLAKQLTR